jgi:hypothetical protein
MAGNNEPNPDNGYQQPNSGVRPAPPLPFKSPAPTPANPNRK